MENHDLGGFAIWSLDLDDYGGSCQHQRFPVLRLLRSSIIEQRAATKHLALDSGKAKLVGIRLAEPVLEYERDGTVNIIREQNEASPLQSSTKHKIKESKFAEDLHAKTVDDTTVPTVTEVYPDPIQEPPMENLNANLASHSSRPSDTDSIKVYIDLDDDQGNNRTESSPRETVYSQKGLGNYAEVLWNAVSTMMDSVTVIVTDEMRSLIPENMITVLSHIEQSMKPSSREKRNAKIGMYSEFKL